MPRWSRFGQVVTRPMAGLPVWRAIVLVGPPFFARGSMSASATVVPKMEQESPARFAMRLSPPFAGKVPSHCGFEPPVPTVLAARMESPKPKVEELPWKRPPPSPPVPWRLALLKATVELSRLMVDR